MGTTSQKLTYLNDTKGLIKNGINAIGGDLDASDTFRSYSEELEGIYESLPKVNGTGETLSLSPTIKGRIQSTLKGNTSQYTTTGKNLFELPNSKSSNGIIYTNNGDGTFNISGQTTANFSSSISIDLDKSGITTGTYTFSCKSKGYTAQIDLYEGNTYISTPLYRQYGADSLTATGTITITNNITKVVCQIYVPTGKTLNLANETIMLESGNQPTNWEEYTGNQPSPNPDYPQDIQVVSGDNTIKVEGKNILDYTNNVIPNSFIVTAQLRIDGVSGGTTTWAKVEPNATYTISRDNGNRLIIAGSNTQPTLNGLVDTIIYDGGTSTVTSYTFTNGNYNYVAIYVSRDTEHTPSWVQLEKNNQATTYTPYVSQTYPISLGNIELCKIGTYQDKIVKDNGKWYLNKQIGKVVLDGSESWSAASSIASGTTRFYYVNNSVINTRENYDYNLYVYSNMFKRTNFVEMYEIDTTNHYLISNYNNNSNVDGRIVIRIDNTYASDVATFKTWLSTHNTIVYYVLATPTYEEITDTTLLSQLNNLYNANSYEGTTNVSQTNDDMPFILDMSMLLDSNTYIDHLEAEVEALS